MYLGGISFGQDIRFCSLVNKKSDFVLEAIYLLAKKSDFVFTTSKTDILLYKSLFVA